MKMTCNDLPNLRFDQCVPYSKMQGRIGWTAHRVSTHINMFCTKRSTGCSTDVPTTDTTASGRPGKADRLCNNCKTKVYKYGMPNERHRLKIRGHRSKLFKRLMPQLPDELRDIILEYQFPIATNHLSVMQFGWDTIRACNWRVKKFYNYEKQQITKDEKESRDWLTYMETHGRSLSISCLTWG